MCNAYDIIKSQFIVVIGNRGPIIVNLLSENGPPPCPPDPPFPVLTKDKLEPATPSVYVRDFVVFSFFYLAA
jgi:hypothetical protein